MSKRVSNKKGEHKGARCKGGRAILRGNTAAATSPEIQSGPMSVVRKDLSLFERAKRKVTKIFRRGVR